MPLAYLRRPLSLLLASYLLLLVLLNAWGFFEVEAPLGWPRRSRAFRLQGRVLSACTEHHVGERMLVRADHGGQAFDVFLLLRRGSCDSTDFLPGQIVEAVGKLRSPRFARLPGDFDERRFCSGRGVVKLMHVREMKVLEAAVPVWWLPAAWAERAHRSIRRRLRASLSVDEARILEGIMLGYKGALDSDEQRSIQDAGVMHLLVPSGAKVALAMALFIGIAFAARMPRPMRMACAALGGAFYCLMVGLEPPYLRAYFGAVAFYVLFFSERDCDSFQAMLLSAFVIVIFWPRSLFGAGYQMTYAASLGLCMALPRWTLSSMNPWLRKPLQAILACAVVQFMLGPIIAAMLGRVSCAGLIANLLLVPYSAWMMGSGFLFWSLSSLFGPGVDGLLILILKGSIWAFSGSCRFFATLPGAAWEIPPMGTAATMAYYAAVLGFLVLPQWRSGLAFWAMAAGLYAFGVIAQSRRPPLELAILGDPRGWASVVKTPAGHTLVDAGLAPSLLRKALKAMGVREIERLVLTSSERGATRGMRAILGVVPTRTVVRAPPGEGWELAFGRLLFHFGRAPGLVTISGVGGGPVEFCILQAPFALAPERCLPAGLRAVGREGAVWIASDGQRYKVNGQKTLYPLGRPFL